VSLQKISVERPVALSMLVLGVMLLGLVSLEKIPVNLLPEITYPKITIRTEYPHAAPREVEERVTKFIESTVGIINNVVRVSSVSRPGWSDVYVEFQWGTNLDIVSMDIREKIQLLENILPEDVGRPVLLRYDPNQDPIMVLAVGGEGDLAQVRRWVEMNVELELERLDGVAAVKVEGGYEDEIVVELDEEKLSRFGLSISSISDRLKRENINLASGTLDEGGNKLAVRTVNRFATIDDIKNVIVLERNAPAEQTSKAPLALSSLPSGGGAGGMMGGLTGGLGSLLASLGGLSSLTAGAAPSAATASAAIIRLKDVAQVRRQHKERTEIARLNNQECIKVSVFKEGDANIVTVAGDVQQAVTRLQEGHRAEPRSPEWERELRSPARKLKKAINLATYLFMNVRPFEIREETIKLEQNIHIGVISDQSQFIMDAIYSVAQNAVIGSIFAVFVLYLFLRNWSATIIVAIAIPVSFITTFNCMYFQGITFNIMSLGGLALGVGVLVDNSIIIIENILRHRITQPNLQRSALSATDEMALPVITGSLTNVIVFFPILYLEGMFRQFFSDLAWTVTYSTLVSAVAAITLVPMLSVVLGKRVRLPQDMLDEIEREGVKVLAEQGVLKLDEQAAPIEPAAARGCLFYLLRGPVLVLGAVFSAGAGILNLLLKYPLAVFDAGFGWLRGAYPRALRQLLRRPFLVSAVSVGIGVTSMSMLYLLSWELVPGVDQGEFRIRIELPTGTPIAETNRRVAVMEERIRRIPGSDRWLSAVFATIGTGTSESSGGAEKAENLGEIHVALNPRRTERDEIIIKQTMDTFKDEVGAVARSAKPQLLSIKAPIEIEIEGDNLDELRAAADLALSRLREVPGLTELESSMGELNPEVNIRIDRDRASALGLSVSAVTDVIQRKVKGEIASRFDLTDQQLDIMVQLEKADRENLERLRRITIPGAGGDIRLEQIAEIKPGLGPAAITRAENSRIALIRANLHARPLGDVVADIKTTLDRVNLPGNCTYRITGQNQEMERSLGSLYLAVGLAILLVYILLASEFESLAHPFIIMFTVPFAMIGMSGFLLVTGQTINASTLIGILMMIGILDNVAIVLVSTINENRDRGMELVEAIVEAGRTRLRPILISNLTTILGMVPMAIAWGPGTELSAPMAITVIGGLTSATILTLLTIPCLYLALDHILPRTYHRHEPHSDGGEPVPGAGATGSG
jgi:hydrophobic/amphiphilic exporter-1 (mainly G- bacteria), HAE1 family